MKAKLWAILLMVMTTLLTSTAQILYKKGVGHIDFSSILSIITNYYIICGLFLYVLGAALMILAFRGGDVSVLYPIIATSYVWVSLLSVHFLGEIMNTNKWIGVITIVIGVTFVGVGSNAH